jgi:hypothetical protein
MKILYDCGILFWYCRIQRTNENILIFQPYVSLIIIDSAEQGEAQVINTTTFAFHNGKQHMITFGHAPWTTNPNIFLCASNKLGKAINLSSLYCLYYKYLGLIN